MPATLLKTAGLLLIGGLTLPALIGCQDTPAPAASPDTVDRPIRPPSYVEREVVVSVDEGTNLAVAVDPVSRDRVLSLQGTLFLLPGDDTEAVALTNAYYDAREPQFAPDGQSVVFQGYRNGNWDIWRVGRDGGAPTAVTNDAYDDREPQYSADGKAVVFSSDRGGRYDVWSIELDSGELTRHTDSGSNAYAPSWSASGALAYAEEGSQTARLMVKHPDGTRQMVTEHAGVMAGVQWSPDGQSIAYQLQKPHSTELRVANLSNGTDTRQSPRGDVFPFRAAWLDNENLAYTADGKVYIREIAPVKRGESADRALWPFSIDLTLVRHDYQRRARSYDAGIDRPAMGLNSLQISDDGAHVYFSALGDLWHWQPERQTLTQLTDDPYAEYAAVLAPDGASLVYVADTDGRVTLKRLDLATGEVQTLGVKANQISLPSFSPDGTQLAFFVDVPGNPLGGQLLVMEIATGMAIKVLQPMPATPISWSADGERVAVTRLNPYSSRYREGLYELLIIDIASEASSVIVPVPHRSISSGVLTADGAMSYVQGGMLHRLELDDTYQPLESAGLITNELTDTPRWSANGEYLVYLSGDRLKRLHPSSGALTDITPRLTYRLDEPGDSYVLRPARIFSGLGDGYLEEHDIWVRGNRITKVAPRESNVTLPLVELADKTVVPGLFEMHAHMGEPSEVQGRVWLSYGITSVRDPGANPYVAKERQEAWDSGRRAGPRTHITGYLTDGNRVFYSMAEGIVSAQHLELALARTEQLELDFIKTYVRLPDHWQRRVVEFAHNLGIPVSSHELYPAAAHGMDHVEHIGGTSRRGYQPKVSAMGHSYNDVANLLSASGMGLTATAVLPGYIVIVDEEPEWFDTPQFAHFYGDQMRHAYEMMLSRFGHGARAYAEANGRLLKRLTEAGALLVTGTDAPFVPYGAGLHAEFRLYDRAGVATADILRQATLYSARAAGVDTDLGTIEAGKLADMVVVDGDPLRDIRDLDNIVMTIKNGRRHTLEALMAN